MKKTLLLSLFGLFLCMGTTWAQAEEPRFPGCEDFSEDINDKLDCAEMKMLQFIFSNLKHPDQPVDGVVTVKFTVNREGIIENPEIIDGLPDCGACHDEVLRIINMMPKWVPGRSDAGDVIDTEYEVEVKFFTK